VWAPDEEEIFLPAKVKATFRRGEPGMTVLDSGEEIPITAEASAELKVVDEQCLKPVENMVTLNDLNNASLLHNLRIRFKRNEIYTNVGAILVAVNPFAMLPIYTPEWLDKYKANGSRGQPPHVYGIADDAYRTMMQDGKNHSIVISGESGAGKTETMKLALQYIAEVSGKRVQTEEVEDGAEATASLEERILKANPVMEAFGNAKTTRNNNSSRFGKWTEIKFDKGGAIIGGSIVNYLLEKSRVVTTGDEERNYHIFYQLFAGCEKTMHEEGDANLMNKYDLNAGKEEMYYISQSKVYTVPGIRDEADWDELLDSCKVIEMNDDDIHQVLSLVAAVLHIGNLEYVTDSSKSEDEAVTVKESDSLKFAAKHLQVEVDDLKQALTSRGIGTHSVIYVSYNEDQAKGARDALAKTIYGNLFDHLVTVVNATLARGLDESKVNTLIGVLDIFGFESFETNSFEQLCINFCNEKLQYHFNDFIFSLEQQQYKLEGINVDNITFEDNQPTLDLIEKKKAPAGIIPRIDEEIRTPKGSDLSFHSKLVKEFGQRKKEHPSFALPNRKVKDSDRKFIVKHYAGPVCYDVLHFLDKSKDTLHGDISSVMRESGQALMKKLFAAPVAKTDAPPSRRKKKSGKSDKKTLGTQFKEQLADLMKRLNTTLPHFVRCFKPNSEKKGDIFTAQMMLEQLNYAGLLEVCRIRQIGYPVRREFAQFLQRYRCLCPSGGSDVDSLMKGLQEAGITTDTDCVKGRSKVFMRNKQAQELEAKREDALSVVATSIQKVARGFICRVQYKRWGEILKKLDSATKAKNVKDLEHYLRQSSELPNHGVHMPAVIAAKQLNERLKEEYRVIQNLTDAIAARELNGLLSAIEVAEGIGNFVTSNEKLGEAKGLLDRIRQERQCKTDLAKALEKRDKTELESLCETAEKLELIECAEYNQAVALLERIGEEEEACGLLQTAVDTEDINDISARLDSMITMGLDDATRYPQFQGTLTAAKEMRAKLKKLIDAKNSLNTAIADRNLGSLRAALTQAQEAGLSDSDMGDAKALVGQIESEEAAMTALKSALSDNAVTASVLAAALAVATGLGMEGDIVDNATAQVKRLGEQATAEAALCAAIASNDASALNDALALARQSGLESASVKEATEALGNLGAQAAMLSKLWQASHSLSDLDAAIAEAEAMGGLDSAIEEAQKARVNLVKQDAILLECETAIENGNYEDLKLQMKAAGECGLDTNPTKADKWSEIKAAGQRLQEVAEARLGLQRAVESHNKAAIEGAIDIAKHCEANVMESKEGQSATAILKQIEREEALTSEIDAALVDQDKDKLQALYDEAQELKLDNDKVRSAGMVVNREKVIKETLLDFVKAKETNDLEKMNKAMQSAIELGIEGPEVDQAKEDLAAMNAEAEQAAKMNAVATAIVIKGQSPEGISEDDLTPLVDAMETAKTVGGLDDESFAMKAMVKRLETFRNQIALVDEIKETIVYSKSPPEDDTIFVQYKRVKKTLDAALELEMETADVEELKSIYRAMDRKVQDARQARNEADSGDDEEDDDDEDDDDEEEEDEEEVERKREEKYTRCSQARNEFTKFSRIRRPEDWVKGMWFGKKVAIATQCTFQNTIVRTSMLDFTRSDLKKEATRIHKCILGYCGDKTMNFPETLARDVLQKGVDNRDLVDEIYVQLCKQLTDNPKKESEARVWQLICMCVGTFPPSAEFTDYLYNKLLLYRKTPGLVGGYANYSLRRLEGILNSGASGFVPSVKEIEAYKQRPPILATIELVDGSPLTTDLPITPDLDVGKVLEICNHFLDLTDPRSKYFGIFVVDEAVAPRAPPMPPSLMKSKGGAPPPPPPPAGGDLPRTPAPLRDQDFMGDVYVSRRRQNRIYKFVFKRKIYIREQTDPSEDDMYKRLDFLQTCDEIITGNIPMDDEQEIINMVAQSVYVDMEEVPESVEELIEEGCLMEYVPQPWKRDHTDEEWGDLVINAMADLDGQDFDDIQDSLVEKVRPHELFGTCFFHVKRVPYEVGAPEPRLVKG